MDRQNKFRFGGLLAIIMICALMSFQPARAQEDKSQAPVLDFFDSGSFDNKLSKSLRKGPQEVIVHFPAPITVNIIPERMDKWLSMVEHYEGTVELKTEETASRGLVGAIIDLIIGAYALAKEKITYGPVENYNAEIWYEKGNGNITKIVFARKEPAQK